MGESDDERYLREKLHSAFGVTLRKLPEREIKTADFEMIAGDQRVAAVEVKTITLTPRTSANGFSQEGPFTTRSDNSSRRVAALIHEAWKQLSGYEALPKVFAFINDEHGADVDDLTEVLQGFLWYGSPSTGWYRNESARRFAEGRVREEKWRIDLYIWFDRIFDGGREVQTFSGEGGSRIERRTEGPFFRCTSPLGYELGRLHLGFPVMSPSSVDEAILPPMSEHDDSPE